MSNLLLFLGQGVLVVLFLPICLLLVLLENVSLGLTEPSGLLLLLLLKGLVPGRILQHFLRILVTLLFELLVVFLSLELELLLELILNFGLIGLKLLNLTANHQLLA